MVKDLPRSMPLDPRKKVRELCHEFGDMQTREEASSLPRPMNEYVAVYGALERALELGSLGYELAPLNVKKAARNPDSARTGMRTAIQEVVARLDEEDFAATYEESKTRVAREFGQAFAYEFSVTGLKRVQELINELRSEISEVQVISVKHRDRLLKRLEALQGELHRRVGNVDRLWGFLLDAGSMTRQLGEDAKPLVDRLRELAEIVWRSQSEALGLPPSASPLRLPEPKDKEE
ncbi:MAG: hypothetical protein O7H41_19660 [Planctomycetota bacterium]|nr:hypothetical protein [Planctomycetota bacterium]